MEIINCIDDLMKYLAKFTQTNRLCFKNYLDKYSNIIYGIDKIDVDEENSVVKLIVENANTIQDPYSIQDVEDKMLKIDKSYYIQVVKIGEEKEDISEVGMSVLNKGFTCSVKSEKRWVMYCV